MEMKAGLSIPVPDRIRAEITTLQDQVGKVKAALAALSAAKDALAMPAPTKAGEEAKTKENTIQDSEQALVKAIGWECKTGAGAATGTGGHAQQDSPGVSLVNFRFCPARNHNELITWFCGQNGPKGTLIYMGDHDLILGKLQTWRDKYATCEVQDEDGADDLTYEPYALMTRTGRPDLAAFVQRRIYAFFSDRSWATHFFAGHFPDKVMSPALAYLFLLNAVDEERCFDNPDASPEADAFADPSPCHDSSDP